MKSTTMKWKLRGLTVALMSTLFWQPVMAQPDEPAAQPTPTPTPPPVILPMERSNYFIGETIPVAVAATDGASSRRLELVDADGRVASTYNGLASVLAIPTSKLRAGQYQFRLNGQPTGVSIGLASTLRPSNSALTNEVGYWTPNADRAMRESGLDALFFVLPGEAGRVTWQDNMAATGALLFTHLLTRPMSFFPPSVYRPEIQSFRHRLALGALANARYPNFGGMCYDLDASTFDDRQGSLLSYWSWNESTEAFRNYLKRSEDAVGAEFTRRTGLQPVTDEDYLRYVLAIGRPEFAPAIDLPTHRWIQAISTQIKPIPEAERIQLEIRVDAWSRYLMGLFEETYAGNNAVLKDVLPSSRQTSSVNLDHAAPRVGHWTPSNYKPLDFRYMTAWNDQADDPDYSFQWLMTAGMLDVGRTAKQPVWIGSPLGVRHVNYPGKMMRVAADDLAYGGLGVGPSLESFTTLLGYGGNGDWNQLRDKPMAEEFISGRDFLRRFAPLAANCAPVRRVGVLFSQSQMTRQHMMFGPGVTPYITFVTLARLGYTPRFVTEDQIENHGLAGFQALVVTNQSVPLPHRVLSALDEFIAGGGRVAVDKSTLAPVPHTDLLNFALPYATSGRPFNWTVPDSVRIPEALVIENQFSQYAPAFVKALGNAPRAPFIAQGDAASKTSTFALDGGADAKYVVAVNDAIIVHHEQWARHNVRLLPNGISQGVVYDVTEEKSLGDVAPLDCRFQDLTARVYAVLPRPIAALDLRATQCVVAGNEVRLTITFRDKSGKPLRAALPFYLRLQRPDKKVAAEFYRATDRNGQFSMTWPVAANETLGTWTIEARSQLDGTTSALPIQVLAGSPNRMAAPQGSVFTRGADDINQLLQQKPRFVLPIFDSQTSLLPVARAVKSTLAARGVEVRIWENPTKSVYTMGYDPTAEQLRANAAAEQGATIGVNSVTTINRNDYFGALSGYTFGQPVILLDTIGVKDNEMSETLDAAGILWPKASADFPGAGRATVQLIKSAFQLSTPALVIQASDEKGMMAGAASLSNLPADWISGGIANARLQLLHGLGIGDANPMEPMSTLSAPRLSADGLRASYNPQPLQLHFRGEQPPEYSAVKPFEPQPDALLAIPSQIPIAQATPLLRLEDGSYEPGWNPGGTWIGDLRFSDATFLKVNAATAGPFQISIAGTFRYSDRQPRSQVSWEKVLALYNKSVPHERRPVSFDVIVDGKPVGSLSRLALEQKSVALDTPPSSGARKAQTVTEEVVTQVSGKITIPAGAHDVILVPHNIVDGQIDNINVEKSPPGEAG